MLPYDPFGFSMLDAIVRPEPRRWPQYSFYKHTDGTCEVETVEPGGSQRATWMTWAPGPTRAKDRQPSQTTFEHPGRPEPTEAFQELVKDLRARNDPAPLLQRRDRRRLDDPT
jgi:hypothetical protein